MKTLCRTIQLVCMLSLCLTGCATRGSRPKDGTIAKLALKIDDTGHIEKVTVLSPGSARERARTEPFWDQKVKSMNLRSKLPRKSWGNTLTIKARYWERPSGGFRFRTIVAPDGRTLSAELMDAISPSMAEHFRRKVMQHHHAALKPGEPQQNRTIIMFFGSSNSDQPEKAHGPLPPHDQH